MKYIFSLIILLTSNIALSDVINCGLADINRLMVQGDREGVHGHENKLLVQLYKNGAHYKCDGYSYVYIDNDDPAYSGMLSLMLAAQSQGKQAEVWVNNTIISGGNAVEMAWITLYN